MSDQLLAKYEFPPNVVQYLLQAVDAQQLRGAEQASSMLNVLYALNNPLNKEELDKAVEDAKAKAKADAAEKPKPETK